MEKNHAKGSGKSNKCSVRITSAPIEEFQAKVKE
jgi:hypothetical protein